MESVAAVRESLDESRVPGRAWQVLALSGGGQWGAFGAGFMKGWTDRGETEPRRPDFRVVTGTSTGSLIATFAFLGSDFDETLRDAYLGMLRGFRDVVAREVAAGKDLEAIISSGATAELDQRWGKVYFPPALFTEMVFRTLPK